MSTPRRDIHGTAAAGFARGAAEYERGRPGYPDDAIALIAEEFGLGAGRRVLDLGAGTGKLTRQLVATGAALVCVEPVAEMRVQLASAVPDAEVIDGTAEAIPLPDSSVDAVVAAQAFHWFDATRALDEIARVLVAGGGLCLMWNTRDRDVAWQWALQALMDRVAGQLEPRYPSGAGVWRSAIADDGRFSPVQTMMFRHEVAQDRDTMKARIASTSYVSVLQESERTSVIEEALALLPPEDPFIETYVTELHWCRLSPP